MDARVKDVLQRVFRSADVGDTASPRTVEGWDSLAHLALVSELEREFGVEFSPDEVLEMVSARIIEEILIERGAIAGKTA